MTKSDTRRASRERQNRIRRMSRVLARFEREHGKQAPILLAGLGGWLAVGAVATRKKGGSKKGGSDAS